jgi:hypothetical protein
MVPQSAMDVPPPPPSKLGGGEKTKTLHVGTYRVFVKWDKDYLRRLEVLFFAFLVVFLFPFFAAFRFLAAIVILFIDLTIMTHSE